MKFKYYKKILLIIFIVFVIYVLFSFMGKKWQKNKENIENIYVQLGNHLSLYFHKMGIAILKKENFKYEKHKEDFIKYLPTEIIFEENEMFKKVYQCFLENGVTYENSMFYINSEWFIDNDNQMRFWICMKPLINYILDDAFKKTGVTQTENNPIIHFRCSDVPFVKHSYYHFSKYEFYKKALENIQEKTNVKYNKVGILFSNGHLSTEEYRNACNTYTLSLKKYLEDLNYEVYIYSKTDIEDFADLFYAPGVISNVSSFSFMSGFFGNGIYITAEHTRENDLKHGCSICKEWMYDGYKLRHGDVFDYTHTENVISLLR